MGNIKHPKASDDLAPEGIVGGKKPKASDDSDVEGHIRLP